MPQRLSPWIRVLYVIAWLPLLGLHTLALISTGEASLAQALQVALYYVLPPSLLGVVVIRICVAMPWSGGRLGGFLARLLGLGLTFALSSGAITVLCFTYLPIPMESAEGSPPAWGVFIGQSFLSMLLYCIIVGFTYAVLGELRSRQQAAVAARAETLRAQAELAALRAQVNPHFLFNTLHTLMILVRRDPQAAEDAIEQFGDLMRFALRVQREECDEVPLAKEWAFARHYLALEELRLGQRMQVQVEIAEEALQYIVPVFSLQPLVENSIGHGIAPRAGGGKVSIRADVSGERLVLEVRDDGPGADDAAIAASDGTGLRLQHRRLATLYGDAAVLRTRNDDDGFAVTVELPARRAPEPPGVEP